MPIRHRVQQGECINSIASEYGFFPDTVWKDPNNQALRDKRKDPNALLPGDVVVVPDKRARIEERPTGARHQFKRKGVPALFRLQIFVHGKAVANEKFKAKVDGSPREGQTDGEGVLKFAIPPDAARVVLEIAGEKHEFDLGHVDPIGEISGVQGRLTNLGYGMLDITGELDEETKAALRNYQVDFGLEPTGSLDDETRDSLAKMHDQVGDGPGQKSADEVVPDDAAHEEEEGEPEDEDLV
jgi:hypothetical protein